MSCTYLMAEETPPLLVHFWMPNRRLIEPGPNIDTEVSFSALRYEVSVSEACHHLAAPGMMIGSLSNN
jgi:hypothetical protein